MTAPAPAAHAGRRRAIAVLKYLALAVVLAWCIVYLARHWADARLALATTHPRWSLLLGSAAVVLAAYAVLIQVWRAILAGAGEHLRYGPAAHIWTVSNL